MFGRKKRKTKAEQASPEDAPMPAPAPPAGRQPRDMPRASFLGHLGAYDLRAPMARSSTVQTAGLHLAVASAPTTHRGLFAGQDTMTGWPVFHDEIEGYRQGTVSSPNICVIGDIGAGKSSFMKTWGVMRHLLMGRRVVVVDKKLQGAADTENDQHEGEYAQVARALGIEPIRFTGKAGGLRINPLDPVITGGEGEAAGQTELLKAILAEIVGRSLSAEEAKALRVAHQTARRRAHSRGHEATIVDVVDYLLGPDRDVVADQRGAFSVEDYLQWGRSIGLALEECVEGDLQGLIDGPTSSKIRLQAGLTVFDISALPDDGPAVPVVMAIINTWLRNTLIAQKQLIPTLFIVEEGWHLVRGSFARISQQNTKKSRGLAHATMTAYQHLSDVPEDSPAIATIKEAGTVLLFRQRREDDAQHCQRLFGLPPQGAHVLMNLPTGCALLLIGSRPPIMLRAIRSAAEAEVANTDSALYSRAQMDLVMPDDDEVAEHNEPKEVDAA